MPKISVIIPTYNREKYLGKCIESILNQTLNDFEMIIIDDGSTDNTELLVSSYNDFRIHYIKRKNHGIGSSRNHGIDIAKGEYITFVDSDDYVAPSFLEEMYNKAFLEQLDIVICDYNNIYEQDNKVEPCHLLSFKNTKLVNHPDLLLKTNLGPCNKLFSKNLFKDKSMRFPENLKYEDVALVPKLFKKARMIGKLDKNLSYFLVDNKSETTVVDNRIFDIFSILDIVIDSFKEIEYQKIIEQLIVYKITTYTIQQRYQKNRAIRNEFIDKSFSYLEKHVPDYKKNPYFINRNPLKSFVEKNKYLTKIYCSLYNLIH